MTGRWYLSRSKQVALLVDQDGHPRCLRLEEQGSYLQPDHQREAEFMAGARLRVRHGEVERIEGHLFVPVEVA